MRRNFKVILGAKCKQHLRNEISRMALFVFTRTSRARHGGAAGNRKCSDMNSEYNGIQQISFLNHEQWSFVLALYPKPQVRPLAPLHLSWLKKKSLPNSPLSSSPPPLLPSPPGAAPLHTHPARKPSEPTECNDKWSLPTKFDWN